MLYENNLGRDDRVISDNSLELRSPFLDTNVVNFSLSLNEKYLCQRNFTENDGVNENEIVNKILLRERLKKHGFVQESRIIKKSCTVWLWC